MIMSVRTADFRRPDALDHPPDIPAETIRTGPTRASLRGVMSLPHSPTLERAAEAVAGWLRARPAPSHGPKILAIDGRSGAGKSGFADLLAPLLGPAPEVTVVRLDDIYPGWDGLAATPLLVTTWVLRPLSAGRPGRFRRWDWVRDRPGGWTPVPAAPIVLLEGAGAGAAPCRPYLTGLVWLDLPAGERKKRALARDGEGYRPHWDRWAAQEEALLTVDPVPEHADLRVEVSTGAVLAWRSSR